MRALTVAQARRQVGVMELESRRFYEAAAARTTDDGTRKLLGELALAEEDHSALAQRLESEQIARERGHVRMRASAGCWSCRSSSQASPG